MYADTLRPLLQRPENANKYDFGHVLIAGGSAGMVGAPLLAAEAALRTGAGLVTIASRAEVIDKLEKRVREVMTLRIPENGPEAIDRLLAFIKDRKVSVLVIGPGQTPEFAGLVPDLLAGLDIPAVIDAAAITVFRDKLPLLEKLGKANPGLILTPHAGEYEKLTGNKPPSGQKELQTTVSHFSDKYHVTLVLKGRHTLVAHPDTKPVYENQTGNPGLATAGTGDILSGIIAGLLAQGIEPGEAARAGVYLHGLAGDLAAAAKTQPGTIASDVIDNIPDALAAAT